MDNIEKMTVAALREQLKSRALPTAGNKPALIQRLTEALNEEKNILQPTEGDNSLLGDADLDVIPDIAEEDVLGLATPGSNKGSTESLSSLSASSPEKSTKSPVKPETEKESTKPETNGAEAATEPAKIQLSKPEDPTAKEKRLERAKKYNTDLSAEDRKALRAERFGTAGKTQLSSGKTGVDSEALKKRADRFGVPVKGAPVTVDEKKKARSDRFSDTSVENKSGPVKLVTDTDEKLKKRSERFGPATTAEEISAKKAKRAERFAVTSK